MPTGLRTLGHLTLHNGHLTHHNGHVTHRILNDGDLTLGRHIACSIGQPIHKRLGLPPPQPPTCGCV